MMPDQPASPDPAADPKPRAGLPPPTGSPPTGVDLAAAAKADPESPELAPPLPAYKPTRAERIEDLRPYLGPALAVVLVLSVIGWVVWRQFAPDTPAQPATTHTTAAPRQTDPVLVDWEQRYQRAVEAGVPEAELDALLAQFIRRQREAMQGDRIARTEDTDRLAQLETAQNAVRARLAARRSAELETEAAEAAQAGRADEAREKLGEALRFQREANALAPNAEARNPLRESRLATAVEATGANPLRAGLQRALERAAEAQRNETWSDALEAYRHARTLQQDIIHRSDGARPADVAALEQIGAEIATLEALAIASRIAVREQEAENEFQAGRAHEANARLLAAVALQREINENFPRSRFASADRLQTLEARRQTIASTAALGRVADLEREIAARLRAREPAAAQERVSAALELWEQTAKEFPRSTSLDPGTRQKLEYLRLRGADIAGLQQYLDANTLPVPGVARIRMLATEVTQELYRRVMNDNPSRMHGPTHPVESVGWHDAQEFCRRLSWLAGAPVRLPSEQEFLACFEPGRDATAAAGHPVPVATGSATRAGYHGLDGNVSEWLLPASEPSETAPVADGSFLGAAGQGAGLTLTSKRERARHMGFRIVVEL